MMPSTLLSRMQSQTVLVNVQNPVMGRKCLEKGVMRSLGSVERVEDQNKIRERVRNSLITVVVKVQVDGAQVRVVKRNG